jgi:O-antigen/teichoic acid export membrane protein
MAGSTTAAPSGATRRARVSARPSVVALRRAGPLAFAGVAANAANVIVTVTIAHLLSSRDYGSLGQLLVLFLVLSMPGSALLVAVVRRVTAWSMAGQADRIKPWASSVRRWGFLGLALLALVAWLSRSWLATALSLPGPDGVAEFLIAGGAWGLLSFERGLIQADRNYTGLAWNLCVEAGVRTTLTVALIGIGLGVEGAGLALMAAMGAAIGHARWAEARARPAVAPPATEQAEAGPGGRPNGQVPARSAQAGPGGRPNGQVPARSAQAGPGGRHEGDPEEVEPEVGPSPVLPIEEADAEGLPTTAAAAVDDAGRGRLLAVDLVAALGALFFLAALQGLDVEIVGRESPGSVGSYNAISVASKAVVFLAIVLSGYLLPEAVVRWRRGGHALSQLGVALVLVAVPVLVLTTLAAAAPDEMLRILFGPDKVRAASAFATLALAMGCLAASTLFTYYLLGIGRRWIVGVLAVATLVTILLVNAAHGHALSTARAELACQGALALILGILVVSAPRSIRSGSLTRS